MTLKVKHILSVKGLATHLHSCCRIYVLQHRVAEMLSYLQRIVLTEQVESKTG